MTFLTNFLTSAKCSLTAGSFTVVAEITLFWLYSYARFFPHGVNLRLAKLRVSTEEDTPCLNSQVVLGPIPQGLQILVVDGGERISADNERR